VSAEPQPPSPIRARISLGAWRHNLDVLKKAAPHAKMLAVIKANAYGHGAVQAARTLGAADAFGVARLGEALELRRAGIKHDIILMEGVFSDQELEYALAHELDLVVHEPTQLEMLARVARGSSIARRPVVWIKLDTGMGRLGFNPAELPAVYTRLREISLIGELRVMTHFACADEPASEMTTLQNARFGAAMRQLEADGVLTQRPTPAVALANSAGILRWPETHADWVRAGIALYGSSPFATRSARSLGLRPVMTLETQVIALRDIATGDSVGYGATWRAPRDSRIAVLAAGYADGVPRQLPSGAPVLLEERRVPLVGRVSMDMITVDVTDVPQVRVGSTAVLWGEGLPADEVATAAGTIAYELFCRVTRRVPLEYFDL
jgi:alanine racemase